MNLSKLFETQKKLDELIVKEKGLHGQDLLDEKILALQVELGELANEWRGFKFWSENQESNTEYVCELCEGNEEISSETAFGTYEMGFDVYKVDVTCPVCLDVDKEKNPLLEEYVDCLHFILSIGLEKEFTELHITHSTVRELFGGNEPMVIRFSNLFYFTSRLYEQTSLYWYDTVFEAFLALGFDLGFTWEQIEQAYYEKNKINHERQASGY